MANKRNLKKQIRYVCGDIAADCLIAGEYVKGVDRDTMHAIVGEIAHLQEHTLQNASFSFDKVPSDFPSMRQYHKVRSAYFHTAYNSLRAKFNSRVEEIVKKMNAALPAEVKEANKAACAKK